MDKAAFAPWRKLFLLCLYTALVTGAWVWWQGRKTLDADGLLQTLPEERMVRAYVDLKLLRSAGFLDVLAGSKTPLEPEYLAFIKATGFDYRTDLEAVAAGFADERTYIAARGRFDWVRLAAYAKTQGGSCQGTNCQMPGSQPKRNISFAPLRPDVLALAVTPEPGGALAIFLGKWKNPPRIPTTPLWVSAPGSMFSDAAALPDGSRAFFSPLAQTSHADFKLSPSPNGFSLDLLGTCLTPAACQEVAGQLTKITELLRKMLARDNLKPPPADLSSVLTGGEFSAQESSVIGRWPMDRTFLDKLVADRLP